MKKTFPSGAPGTRLYRATQAISKKMESIYDKLMIHYPLSALMSALIRNIHCISPPHDSPLIKKLQGYASRRCIQISNKEQLRPESQAHTFIFGRGFIDNPIQSRRIVNMGNHVTAREIAADLQQNRLH